ncbi:hypothetical protein GCM10029978_105580 [Actinoallomurus acanthiterrae]
MADFAAHVVPWWAIVVLGVLCLLHSALCAILLYALAKSAIDKSEPENLDKVVRAIAALRMPMPNLRLPSPGKRK